MKPFDEKLSDRIRERFVLQTVDSGAVVSHTISPIHSLTGTLPVVYDFLPVLARQVTLAAVDHLPDSPVYIHHREEEPNGDVPRTMPAPVARMASVSPGWITAGRIRTAEVSSGMTHLREGVRPVG